jgi:5-methylcytosine-specific restriction protein A
MSTSYQRDAAVVAWVLRRAAGRCEYCGRPAPFLATNGVLFLEVHPVLPLSEGGEATPADMAAICPHCHREAHYGERALEVRGQLQQFLGSFQ